MSTIEKALGSLKHHVRPKRAPPPRTVERVETSIVTPNPSGSAGEAPVGGAVAKRDKPRIFIPFDELHSRGFIIPAKPRSTVAEEFRAIKRPILKNIDGKSTNQIPNANLVMVTSALEGDGKTFSSLNLAMSIALEQDRTVLYVDADVLKASAGSLLGVPEGIPGLIDLVTDEGVTPADVILETNVDNLRILPAGRPDQRATELLASDSMHQLMLEMSARYPDRVIIFDSPPLLLTTESGVLASFMGQIVFVAAADITPRHAVLEALEFLGEDKMVGVMLNRISRGKLGLFGKGYGYGYGYGYGSARLDDSTG